MYIKYYNTIEYYKTILKKTKSISDTNNSFEIKYFVNSSGLASWTSQLDEYILVCMHLYISSILLLDEKFTFKIWMLGLINYCN